MLLVSHVLVLWYVPGLVHHLQADVVVRRTDITGSINLAGSLHAMSASIPQEKHSLLDTCPARRSLLVSTARLVDAESIDRLNRVLAKLQILICA